MLPLIEGSTVSTKYGSLKTDHILFIASGAFHLAKLSDLLPELQGRLPNRVELSPLIKDDFIRILKEPENNLLKQYIELISSEGVKLTFLKKTQLKKLPRLLQKLMKKLKILELDDFIQF